MLQAVETACLLNFCIHKARGFYMCQISKDNFKKSEMSTTFSLLMLNLHSPKLCPAPASTGTGKAAPSTQHSIPFALRMRAASSVGHHSQNRLSMHCIGGQLSRL